jgi:hypothetical protein
MASLLLPFTLSFTSSWPSWLIQRTLFEGLTLSFHCQCMENGMLAWNHVHFHAIPWHHWLSVSSPNYTPRLVCLLAKWFMIYHFTDEQVRLFNSLSFFPLKSSFIFMLYLYSTLFAYHRVPTYAKRFSCYITKFDHFDPIRQLTRQFSKRCKINFPSSRVDSARAIN